MGVVGRCAAHRTPARRYSTLSDLFAAACYLLAGAPRAPYVRGSRALAARARRARRIRHDPRRHLLVILPPRTTVPRIDRIYLSY